MFVYRNGNLLMPEKNVPDLCLGLKPFEIKCQVVFKEDLCRFTTQSRAVLSTKTIIF